MLSLAIKAKEDCHMKVGLVKTMLQVLIKPYNLFVIGIKTFRKERKHLKIDVGHGILHQNNKWNKTNMTQKTVMFALTLLALA